MGNSHGAQEKKVIPLVLGDTALVTSTQEQPTATTSQNVEEPSSSESSVSFLKKKVTFNDYDHVSVIESHHSITSSRKRRFRCHRFIRSIRSCCTTKNALQFTKRRIPVLSWLPEYKYRSYLLSDIIAGLTTAVLHVPQGLAYSLLANVEPVVGIYMGIFPVFVYFLLGTSRHVSLGTFAVVTLMTGKIINTHSTNETVPTNSTFFKSDSEDSLTNSAHLQIATSISAMVGIWFFGLFFCNLGIFSTILSKTLVSSFTCAASIHVLLSQVPEMLGLRLKPQFDIFGLIHFSIRIAKHLVDTNVAALILTLITCAILLFNVYVIKPRTMKWWGISIPTEIVVIIIFTVISKYALLSEKHDVSLVGNIPSGIPPPSIPTPSIMWAVLWDSFVLTLVSYSISVSVAFMLVSKCDYNHYDIDPQQELLALGVANLVGAFCSCLPIGTSLTRSLVQLESGGRTQVASFVSCVLLIIALLLVGPFIKFVPRCVLAGIIIVALRGMLFQIVDLPAIWRASTRDGFLWIVTFFSVVLIDIVYGLAIAILFSLISIYYQSTIPSVRKFGILVLPPADDEVPNHIYLDMQIMQVTEILGTKIIQIASECLNFANKNKALLKIEELTGVSPHKVLARMQDISRLQLPPDKTASEFERLTTVEFRVFNTGVQSDILKSAGTYTRTRKRLNRVIIDLSLVETLDHSAVLSIKSLVERYNAINIRVVVVSNSEVVQEKLKTVTSISAATVAANAIQSKPVLPSKVTVVPKQMKSN